jgi:ribonuclease P protein component
MQREIRLRLRKQFSYVYHRGTRASNNELTLVAARGNRVQVGFSLSKKVGNAVQRNRIKRRLREIVRLMQSKIRPGCYVVVARESAKDADYLKLSSGLYNLFDRQKCLTTSVRTVKADNTRTKSAASSSYSGQAAKSQKQLK